MGITRILCKVCGGDARQFDGTGFYCPTDNRYLGETERLILDGDDNITRDVEQHIDEHEGKSDAKEEQEETADAIDSYHKNVKNKSDA